MQSNQSDSNDYFDDTEPKDATGIPDFVRAWESSPQVASVRRPSTLPDPQLFHEVIEPQAIFELDEIQEDGSIETILVVTSGCERCKKLKQACSRALPACVRCRKAGLTCVVLLGGHQKLPGPKLRKEYGTNVTSERSVASIPTQDLTTRRPRQLGSARVASLSQASPSRPSALHGSCVRRSASTGATTLSRSPSVASGSKRPPSPEYDPAPPRKKAPAKHVSRKREARCSTNAPQNEMDVEYAQVSAAGPSTLAVSTGGSVNQHNILKWTFVNREEKSTLGPHDARPIPSDTPIPRVWANSLDALLMVFPELAKSTVRFSWFQSETPILLLDDYARGDWLNSTALKIDLLWDFSCHTSELEPIVESDTAGPSQLHSCQPVAHFAEYNLEREAEMMGSRNLPPGNGLRPYLTAPAPPPTSMPPWGGRPQIEWDAWQDTWVSYAEGTGPIFSAPRHGWASATLSGQLHSRYHGPLSLPANSPPSHPYFIPNGSLFHYTTSQPDPEPRIPFNKPPEVETLLNSNTHSIPLLLWLSHDSGLVPCNLPPEYAYSSMGLFFISDLRHAVVQHSAPSPTGFVQGRVRWSVTLEWAPGGEDALFDCNSPPLSDTPSDSASVDATRNVLCPWWFDPTDTSSQAGNTNPRRHRDFRMQVFSFIPLDLLGEFHPSDSFPRGWFCKSCGMINIQVHFRHQICQSTTCKPARDKLIRSGKVESLSSLRDPHQAITLTRPTIKIPSDVDSDNLTWDDGMQSWIYNVQDSVTLCHIFTGNQGDLQLDATALLESIQCEVLLFKGDPCSPHFIHNTRLTHPSDGSEIMVPTGTPNCVRVAYYTLCDLVHRYGEMDKPRFGEVRMLAWDNTGTRKGNVLHASKSPAAIHCLGAEVVLNFVPKGGYKGAEASAAPDKGKGRAEDDNRTGSPTSEPCAGPSCHPEQVNGNQTPSMPGTEANETPIVAENEANVAMDTIPQCSSHDDSAIPLSDPNTCSGMEVTPHAAVKRRGRKENKVTKDKIKASVPEISMTLVHGDCVVLLGDDFECKIVRTGTTILVIGLPEET